MKKTYCYQYPRPSLTVDVALFRETEGEREILLIQRKNDPFAGKWALPGGFVDENEKLEAAAARELQEETGLRRVKLRQLAAFGDPGRDPRGHTVSIAFIGEVSGNRKVKGGDDAADARWFALSSLPTLAFDHRKIIREAVHAGALG